MSAHKIDIYSFEFWREGPPVLVTEQVDVHTRPGADSVGLQRIGEWHGRFRSILVAHRASYALAMSDYSQMRTLVGQDSKAITYNGLAYQAVFSHRYYVVGLELLACRVKPRLKGPGYDFVGGAELTVAFSFVPQKL